MKYTRKLLILKATAFALSLCLTIGLLVEALPAFAETVNTSGMSESGINKNLNTGDLNSLGFTTSGDVKKDIDSVLANDKMPYGEHPFSLFTAGEFLTQSGGNILSKTALYDNGGNVTGEEKWHETHLPFVTPKLGLPSCDYRNLCELDANGDGRKNFVAQYAGKCLGGDDNNEYMKTFLSVMDADNRHCENQTNINTLPFAPYPVQANAYLAMTTGDFDGDGKDEIAICDAFAHVILFYRVIVSTDQNGNTSSISLSEPVKKIELNSTDNMYFSANSYGTDGDDDYKEQLELPVVSMCSVRQSAGSVDTLAMVVNYGRYQDEKKVGGYSTHEKTYSRLVIISSPLDEKNTKTTVNRLRWRWGTDYGAGREENSKYSQMAFAGVSAGDIDQDNENEIVVGGYNYTSTDIKSKDWDLSKKEYLINWYDYDAKNDTYTEAMSGAQFISIDTDDYGRTSGLPSYANTDIDDAIYNNKNSMDAVLNPMVMKCYAGRGSGYGYSVFMNGLVLNLGSKTKYGKGYYVNTSLGPWDQTSNAYDTYKGYPDKALETCCKTVFRDKGFLVQFTAPLCELDTLGRFKNYMKITNRAIIAATACTYDTEVNSNSKTPSGIETLLFTYVTKVEDRKWHSQFVGSLCATTPGDEEHVNNITSKKTTSTSHSGGTTTTVIRSISNLTWQHKEIILASDNPKDSYDMFGVASPDVGHDSIIMRPAQGQNTDFYFSDPQLIAIMQADPYFSELDYSSDNGSTAFTSSKSTSSGVATDFSVTAGASFGIETGFSAFDLVKIGFKTKTEATISLGYTGETSTTYSTSRCFATSEKDSVALAMTPYIRYYYQIWDATKGEWADTNVDIPREPQISQISVSQYDDVAVGEGWDTIYQTVLKNTAGDPRTYLGTPSSFESAGPAVGVGSGSGTTEMSIASEQADTNGVTWGFGLSNETEFTSGIFTVGFSIASDYSGSYTTTSSTGYEYSGSVMTVPEEDYSKYNFQWQFGVWNSELTTGFDTDNKPVMQKCIVLGYVCSDVSTPPKAPDVHVYSVSDSSVTLKWNNDISYSNYYSVYRYLESSNTYHYLGIVEGNPTDLSAEFIFTDKYCEPDTDYQYSVVAMKGSASQKSKNSRLVTAHTNPKESDILKLISSPSNFYGKTDETALFKVVAEAKGKGSSVKYQWQKYSESGWENLINATEDVYQINSVIAGMNGKKFRCIVTRLVNGKEYSIISSPATLIVGNLSDSFIKDTEKPELIWFDSATKGGKSNEIGFTEIRLLPDPKSYMPTFFDKENLNLTVTGTQIEGNNITVTYSDATVGDNIYISGLLMDSNDRIKYYGKLKKPDLASGSCTIDLSSVSISQGDILYLFAEQINSDIQNDYCSEPVYIPMIIYTKDTEGFTITGIKINSDGNLIITLSNGEIKDLGKITGSDGKNGADGKDGINGVDGKNGADGKDGINGVDGKDGADGKNGINGVDGKDGADGKDGINGVDGKDGADGKDGINGVDGKDGADGKDGINGVDGKDGADGKDGINGVNGKDGVGISNISLNDNGHFIVATTTGKNVDIGKQFSPNTNSNSENGSDDSKNSIINGKDGTNGVNGKNGINGKDGVGIKTISMNTEGNFVFGMTDGSIIEVKNSQSIPASAKPITSNNKLVYIALTLSIISCAWNGVTFVITLKKRQHAVL